MPDHLQVLMTPSTSLEKAVQFIKGGFSYRAKKELASNLEIWQKGFSDHRIRDASDYRVHAIYIRQNPVRRHLCEATEQYSYSSASSRFELDSVPQGLKPTPFGGPDGAAEAAPFQSNTDSGHAKSSPFRKASATDSVAEPLQPVLKDFK
jgi:putative transposase